MDRSLEAGVSRAFQCDHCGEYFDGNESHWIKREVCDKKAGFVRYRTTMFVHSADGPQTEHAGPGIQRAAYERSSVELCGGCIKKILLASLNKEKL
jgi:hypothetical protein